MIGIVQQMSGKFAISSFHSIGHELLEHFLAKFITLQVYE